MPNVPDGDEYSISHFVSKTVPFKFRGIKLNFDLTQGLFSSVGVDSGTQLLLKVFSKILDDDKAVGKPLPRRVLDAGCGVGIIGICAAAAIMPRALSASENSGLHIRCQDRDELARLFTLNNAKKNNIPPSILEAHTEPLLAGPPGARWDLIFTNIPAKAGAPVLEDFVRRSASLLNPGGRILMVAVNTLADFFRDLISSDKANIQLLQEVKGPGHTVFVYTGDCQLPVNAGTGFLSQHPHYFRTTAIGNIEKIPVHLETIHGTPGYDSPGGTVVVAAKIITSLFSSKKTNPGNEETWFPMLIHEPGQGFFPCWLISFLNNVYGCGFFSSIHDSKLVLSSRNILALEAARHNIAMFNHTTALIAPAADLQLSKAALLEATGGQQYRFIAAFPELLPQSSLPKIAEGGRDQLTILWDALPPLLCEGGIFLAAFNSSEAERFDRKKPQGFTRLGSIKRNGFRALAYCYK